MNLNEFKDKHYGVKGTRLRDELDGGHENFKIGALFHEARIRKGMTQEELAKKSGTTKSYISKIENNVKEVRFQLYRKLFRLGWKVI